MSQFINILVFLIKNSIRVRIILKLINLHLINDYKDFLLLRVYEFIHYHIFMEVNNYYLNEIIHMVRLDLIIGAILNDFKVIQQNLSDLYE